MKPIAHSLVAVLFGVVAGAQQPNSPLASLTVDGNDGPSYPMTVNVRNNTTSTFVIQGAPNAPFAMYVAANGQLHAGSVSIVGGIVDLPLSPVPVLLFNGFADPTFNTGPTTVFTLPIAIAPTVGVGFSVAEQLVVASASSASGFRLSAATREVVTQGPITVSLNVGDDTTTPISLSQYGITFPFYGINYSSLYLGSNGYLTFGGGDTSLGGGASAMNGGLPRISGYWTDLLQSTGQFVGYTVDSNPGPGAPPWIRFDWLGVSDYNSPTTVHTFSLYLDTSGFLQIIHPVSATAPIIDALVGISPGNNLSAVGVRDLSATLNAGATLGAPNEAFFEYFSLTGVTYDLYGRTINFLPSGAGNLPGSTNRYTMY